LLVQQTKKPRRVVSGRPSHDLAYVLGQGASVGRSRVVQDAVSVAPIVLVSAFVAAATYLALVQRGGITIVWSAAWIVAAALATLPFAVTFVLVSLRDHRQPVTISVFVTAIGAAFVVAVLSATRLQVSYLGVMGAFLPAVLGMILVMLRLQQAQNERVGMLDFPGAAHAAGALGGRIPIIRGGDEDLGRYDRLLIDAQAHYSDKWSRFLLRAYMRGVLVTPWVQFLELRTGRVDIESFDPSDIVLRPGQILYSRIKRLTDIVGVLVLLPVVLPLGLVTALYILVRAGSPVLFVQERRGHGGRTFNIYKFRTMRRDASADAATAGDSRIVPGTAAIRRFRLDELPQLFNILKGEMSFVGPRPESIRLAQIYEDEIPRYVDRVLVRPGLTGWAQVNTAASATVDEARRKLAYDLYYIKHMSLDLDIVIAFRTIRTLVVGLK
jgi:lipopolysaccharide/colanic/teichoic acid biosynthesis glycosyltransferase